MKKVKFLKIGHDVCICLDDSLFKNDSEQIIKTSKSLELFSDSIERYEGTVLIDVNNKSIINDLNNFDCSFELIHTTKTLFKKRDKDNVYKVSFHNEQIEPIVNFMIKNDLTFECKGYKNNDESLLGIVINDNDGSYITFNDKIFIKEKYKQLINDIINN